MRLAFLAHSPRKVFGDRTHLGNSRSPPDKLEKTTHTVLQQADLTQNFFSRLLEKNYCAKADRDRGKFRTFLLGSLKNFLVNEWKRASRLKRGGDLTFLSIDANVAEDRYATEPANESNPDAAYEQRWAVTLIEHVLATLRREYSAADKAQIFEELKGSIWGDKSTAP